MFKFWISLRVDIVVDVVVDLVVEINCAGTINLLDGSIVCLVAWRGLHRFAPLRLYIGFARTTNCSNNTFLWRARSATKLYQKFSS